MTAVASAWRVEPLASADAISSAEWNALACRGAHLHGWCAAAERSGWRPRHVAVTSGAAVQLIVPAYYVAHADHDLHDRWLGPLRGLAAAVGLRLRPTLVVGPPVVQTSAPVGELDHVPDALLEEAFGLLEELARRDGARAIAWPFLEPDHERIIYLGRRRGYAALYAGASAYLPVPWDSFDDYVASRSKSVRRTIRSDLRMLESVGLRVDVTADFAPHAGAIDALFREFFRRRNGHVSVLPKDFFAHVADQAARERGIVAQLIWHGHRLVGMSLNLMSGGVMDGTFSAMAAEHEGGAAYYNDLIYAPLAASCGAGLRRLELGPTALYAKVLRGASLRRRTTLVRGLNPVTHTLLDIWGRQIAGRTERKELDLLAPLGGARCFA